MGACNVAAIGSGDRMSSQCQDMARGQAEVLMPMVCDVMSDAKLEFKELEAIVTTLGPGAFTGLRIGLSVARSLGLALSIPVFGVSSLQAIAYDVVTEHRIDGRLKVLIESKRDDFYVQDFDGEGCALSEARALSAMDIVSDLGESDVLAGDAVERFQGMLDKPQKFKVLGSFPSAMPENMARGFMTGRAGYSEDVTPIYLRGADVSQSKKTYRSLSV